MRCVVDEQGLTMPVILHRDVWEVWQEAGPEELLRPWDGAMTVEPISPDINSSRNEGAELLNSL